MSFGILKLMFVEFVYQVHYQYSHLVPSYSVVNYHMISIAYKKMFHISVPAENV